MPTKEYMRAWRDKNRDKVNQYHYDWIAKNPNKWKDVQLKTRYGISYDDYQRKLEEQGHRCAICKKGKYEFKKNFSVDHNHTTGQIRSLLCQGCNIKVGAIENNLEELLEYLKKWAETESASNDEEVEKPELLNKNSTETKS